MSIIQTINNRVVVDGVLVTDEAVEVDVTVEVVTLDLHSKARAALAVNQTFLDRAAPTNAQTLAQVQRLTRECSAIIRLLVGSDLLDDTATDT